MRTDLFYLEDIELARQLVELGYRCVSSRHVASLPLSLLPSPLFVEVSYAFFPRSTCLLCLYYCTEVAVRL